MKKLIFITAICFLTTVSIAQTRDSQGNFKATAKTTVQHDSTTTFTYTDAKGNVEPVYIGKKGSYYVSRISKKGNYYRKYMKKD